MNKNIVDKYKNLGHVIENADMSKFTSFKSGGPAELLIFPSSYEKAGMIYKEALEDEIPLTIIGGGTNLLVSDSGIEGIVMRISGDNIVSGKMEIVEDNLIYCDALIKKRDFITFAADNGFGGVEFMVGIPGCIGGGIVMNAGTYMGTFIDVLKRIKYIDKDGNVKERSISKKKAHYRFFEMDDAEVILGGYFELTVAEDREEVRKNIREIINDRKNKHPWTYPSAGSVFKNPDGYQSWKLVNDSGLKGYRIGDAMVSTLHTNFIINDGKANSSDIKKLIEHIQHVVKEKFNVALYTEIRMLGEFS